MTDWALSRPGQPPLIYILTCLYLIQSIKKNINLLIDILGFDLVLKEYEEQKERLTCRICTENLNMISLYVFSNLWYS
jgi:hypothetical protein